MARIEADRADTWLVEDLSPTAQQSWSAFAVAAIAFIGFVAVAPFAGTPLVELNAFFPTLDAVVFVTDLVTAVLLFGQFSISRSRALGFGRWAIFLPRSSSSRMRSPSPAPFRRPDFSARIFKPDRGSLSSGILVSPRHCLRGAQERPAARSSFGIVRPACNRLDGGHCTCSGVRSHMAGHRGSVAVAAHHPGQDPHKPDCDLSDLVHNIDVGGCPCRIAGPSAHCACAMARGCEFGIYRRACIQRLVTQRPLQCRFLRRTRVFRS